MLSFFGQETISQENLLSALTLLATVYSLIFLGECDRRLLISPHPALNGHQSKWTCSLDDKELLAPATMTASLYCNHSVSSFSCYADCELWDCLCAFQTRGWYFSTAHLLKMSKSWDAQSPCSLFCQNITAWKANVNARIKFNEADWINVWMYYLFSFVKHLEWCFCKNINYTFIFVAWKLIGLIYYFRAYVFVGLRGKRGIMVETV